MKRTLLSILLASALMPLALPGQTPTVVQSMEVKRAEQGTGQSARSTPTELRFDLNFPGGNPKEFVAAIEKAMNKPLNTIVPDDCNDVQIPPLKMSDVSVGELFHALRMASIKRNNNVNTPGYPAPVLFSYGFETSSPLGGDNSVWYFQVQKPTEPPPIKDICRFYQLEPLLEKNKIEDITTAIQSGWEMLHVTKVPQLKFHPETKLLIAVGSEENLQIIESVLEQLRPRQPAMPGMPRPLLPVNPGTPK
jgi:hypothetical protein